MDERVNIEHIIKFLNEKIDAREYRRGLAIKLVMEGYLYKDISAMLNITEAYISKWKKIYEEKGVEGLRLGYKGANGYLSREEKQVIVEWLKEQEEWNLEKLQIYIKEKYEVEFKSNQSYYELFAMAKISWKKTQKNNPQGDPIKIESKKKEIIAHVTEYKEEIENEERVVLFADECHLLWGDLCGYGWGKTEERLEVDIINEREKQTYYGAINSKTGEMIIKEYETANTVNTINFLEHLRKEYKDIKLTIIWDGASFHKKNEMPTYLESINGTKEKKDWEITCINFAPNAPEQNPIEDIWLKGKNALRKHFRIFRVFKDIKAFFTKTLDNQFFDFKKLHMYN